MDNRAQLVRSEALDHKEFRVRQVVWVPWGQEDKDHKDNRGREVPTGTKVTREHREMWDMEYKEHKECLDNGGKLVRQVNRVAWVHAVTTARPEKLVHLDFRVYKDGPVAVNKHPLGSVERVYVYRSNIVLSCTGLLDVLIGICL